jgi:hypothetical protein
MSASVKFPYCLWSMRQLREDHPRGYLVTAAVILTQVAD